MENTTDSPSYTLVSLPTDVFTIIVGQIDKRDCKTLLSLCLTNRFLGWEATKRLYRELGPGNVPTRASFHRKLLHTLISRPELAAMVRSYTSRDVARVPEHDEETLRTLFKAAQLRSQDSDPEEDGGNISRGLELAGQLIWVLLDKALPLMINLKELVYGDSSGVGRASSALLVSGRFQLKKLDWRNRWDDTFFDFLKTQKDLKWLKIHPRELKDCIGLHPIAPFTSGEILTTLSGKQAVVEAILPFAPGVRNLALHFTKRRGTFSSIFDVGKEMARYMGQIRRLTFHNCSTLISVAVFDGAVDNLEYLAVGYIMNDDAKATAFISRLRKLKMFVVLRSGRRKVWTCHSLEVDLFRESNSLQQVVLPFYFMDIIPDEYGLSSEQSGTILMSRGSDVMRRLEWKDVEAHRFLLPMCDEDASSPGWIDMGRFFLPADPHATLYGFV